MSFQNKDSSKKFLLEFFKNSKIEDKDGILSVSEVPEDFENFVGKKSPYKFVFDINLHSKTKDSELIMQGSYFLLAIRDYLSDKGQTSLLKINLKPNLAELSKNLKKGKILEIKEAGFNYFYEFSFLSNYQYLNDKNQSTTKMLIKEGNIFDVDLSKLDIIKGNAEEIESLDLSKSYQTATKILDEKVKKEIKPFKIILKEKLDKELFRVKDHYSKQIKEKDEEVETCANKIKMLQSKLRHTSYERDRNILTRMIRESGERLEMLKKRSYKERLEIEEKFHINDEVEKHVLSIKNNLINVSVYYYPIYEVKVSDKIINYDFLLETVI